MRIPTQRDGTDLAAPKQSRRPRGISHEEHLQGSIVEQMVVIVQHTPWWVFAVLALLIATGVQALRPRVVPVWRLLIVPAIFIAWGVLGVTQRSFAAPMLAA